MACSKCGEPGHYAPTCGRNTKSTQPSGAKRKAGAAAKRAAAPAPAALPAELPGGTVLEQLRARCDQIRQQLEGVKRLQRELEVVEATIEQLAEIEGGA